MTTEDAAAAPPSRGGALIFQSYGWGDAADIAKRVKDTLEDAGYEVWLDRERIRADDQHFWLALEKALGNCELVVALLSPHSVRLEGDLDTAHGASVCHYELMMAVRKELAVLPIVVIKCDTPLAIIRYEPLDFTDWAASPDSYRAGIGAILGAIRNIRAGDRRYVIYVDKLSPYDFFAELRTAAGTFVGREWLLARLDAWCDGSGRCFLVEAEPGSGKTAFVAELVRRNPGSRVLAYHFCNSLKPDTVNARMFVRTIAAMLCGTVSAYKQRLRSSEELVSALKSNDPTTMLSQGVLAALRAVPMAQTRYIIVDALDEAAGAPTGEGAASLSIPQLLAQAIDEFPPWLKLVATTRRDDRVLPLFQNAERCFLGEAVAAQRMDLQHYVERRLAVSEPLAAAGSDAAARNRTIATIVERSAGNFQYADTVIAELRTGDLAVEDVHHLPRELVALYYRLAARRFPERTDFRSARAVVGVLLAARQPLTRPQLAAITGLDRDGELASALDSLSCFVTWDTGIGDERVYRPAHKSISDWLIAPPGEFDRFKVDLEAARAMLLAHCRLWATHRDPYALTHLIAHLLEAGLPAAALAAVRDDFFAARAGAVDPRHDLDDSRLLTLALVGDSDEGAILALARTENVWQRDGVAAALQAAPAAAGAFVDRIVAALLRVAN